MRGNDHQRRLAVVPDIDTDGAQGVGQHLGIAEPVRCILKANGDRRGLRGLVDDMARGPPLAQELPRSILGEAPLDSPVDDGRLVAARVDRPSQWPGAKARQANWPVAAEHPDFGIVCGDPHGAVGAPAQAKPRHAGTLKLRTAYDTGRC